MNTCSLLIESPNKILKSEDISSKLLTSLKIKNKGTAENQKKIKKKIKGQLCPKNKISLSRPTTSLYSQRFVFLTRGHNLCRIITLCYFQFNLYNRI